MVAIVQVGGIGRQDAVEILHLTTGRIFGSLGPGTGLGQRLVRATALTVHGQKPATNAFVVAKGPPITSRDGPSKAIRLPSEQRSSPSRNGVIATSISSTVNW